MNLSLRPSAGRSLKGSVVDRAGSAIPGAEVVWVATEGPGVLPQRIRVVTGPGGTFAMRGMQDASGGLEVKHDGHVLWVSEDVRAGPDPMRVALVDAPQLRGRIVMRNGASLPADVWIAESGPDISHSWQNSRVGADGSFRCTASHPGEPTTFVLSPRAGALKVLGRFVLAAEEQRDLGEVEVDDGRTVRGIVIGPDGNPIPAVSVVAEPRGFPGIGDGFGARRCQDTTASDGRFEIHRVTTDAAVLSTAHGDYAPSTVEVVGPGDLRIVLRRGAYVTGRLLAADGAALPRTDFRLEAAVDGDPRSFPGITDAQGCFVVGPLPAAPFVARLSTGAGAPAVELARLTLAEGERRSVEWRVP